MQLTTTPDDEAFRAAARAWLAANGPAQRPPRDGKAAADFTRAWLARCQQGGWAGIAWPKEYGGQGLPPQRILIWYEEYVRSRAPSVLDGSYAGGPFGPDQAKFDEDAMQECIAILSDAGLETPAPEESGEEEEDEDVDEYDEDEDLDDEDLDDEEEEEDDEKD